MIQIILWRAIHYLIFSKSKASHKMIGIAHKEKKQNYNRISNDWFRD